jgi:predicted nucleic acid-binding protein
MEEGLLPAELGREFAHSMAMDHGRDLDPITVAGSARFRSLHALGGVRPEPWVIDANELYGAVLHTARTGKANLLARAASAGKITWYVAEHAADEVDEHLDQWANGAGIDPVTAWRSWDEIYRPMLRLIPGDLTDLAFTADEQQRLAKLALRDSDDLPTARLAMAIGARLVTRDGALLEATYGPGRTSSEHADELIPTASALNSSGHLREMEAIAVLLPAVLIAEMVAVVRRMPALGAAGIGAAALALRSRDRRRQLHAGGRRFWAGLGTALEVWMTVHQTISEQLARYEPVVGDLTTTAEELDTDARSRIIMWMLARRDQADASATDLASTWPAAVSQLRSTAAIRSTLHAGVVFIETTRGRFQLGCAPQPPTGGRLPDIYSPTHVE